MSQPIIRHISNCIKGGFLTVLTGDDFIEPEVHAHAMLDGSDHVLEIVNREDTRILTCKMPQGGYQAYRITVRNRNGEESAPYMTNIPSIKWIQDDLLTAGRVARIFGQGFVNIDLYPEREKDEVAGYAKLLGESGCYVTVEDAAKRIWKLQASAASNYEISVMIPQEVALGECTVTIDSSVGAPSACWKTLVTAPLCYPEDVFNVCDYGARAIPVRDVRYEHFFDSTAGFQAALDAARDNGGGVVFVPAGRYCFLGGLKIYPHTCLRGESRNRVWLELSKGMARVDGSLCDDGWGTVAQGEAIHVFLGGVGGDFTVENLNFLSVYSPVIIGAPVIEGEPLLGDDKFNRLPCYANLIDAKQDADHVVIRNCDIIHEPTFMDHRKKDKKNDKYYIDEYDGSNPYGEVPLCNFAGITNVWAAVAVKGSGTQILNNKIQGAGTCAVLMGAVNCTVSGNTLYCGDLANCLGLFSTSYNPDDHWKRSCHNIVIENNILDIATKLNRGVLWIMQDHYNYYMAHNVIRPFFWHSDAEGFCFHIWGDHLVSQAVSGKDNKITLDHNDMLRRFDAEHYRRFRKEDGTFKDSYFRGGIAMVVGGRGIGQKFRILDNTGTELLLDGKLDCELDATSKINICDSEVFANTIIVDNELNEMGRGIYLWGATYGGIVDGNLLRRNSGAMLEDLSGALSEWHFAGEYFCQMINNRLEAPRGFCTNYGVIGVKGGNAAETTVSVIIRGNVALDDSIIAAKPRVTAGDGLNYEGVVIEGNLSRDCDIGIEVDHNIGVTIKDNAFENVREPIVGAGEHTVML